jgi:hypothetical protein
MVILVIIRSINRKTMLQPMPQASTPLDLIAYLYREMPVEQSFSLRRELAVDALLREQFEELDAARRMLPKATFAPADATLTRILAYSRQIPAEA